MEEPCTEDGLTLDAVVCIQYALRFGKVRGKSTKSFSSDRILKLVNKCKEKNIPICYYKFIADEAYKNLTKAVNNFCTTTHNNYLVSQFDQRARDNLDRLFKRLDEVELICTQPEFDGAKQFFRDNERDVNEVLGRYYEKDNIPDDQDILLLISSHNQSWDVGYISSNDGHFLAYKDIIEDNYDVIIIPMNEILNTMIDWSWVT